MFLIDHLLKVYGKKRRKVSRKYCDNIVIKYYTDSIHKTYNIKKLEETKWKR